MKILFIGARLFNDVAEYTKRIGVTTILSESNPKAPNLRLADKFYIVPRGMETPMELAIREDVDGVVPLIGVDEPLLEVARMKEKLEGEYGIPVVASDTNATLISIDKIKTKESFKENNINTPDYHIIKEGDPIPGNIYPIVLKQRRGQGGQDLFIAQTRGDVNSYLHVYKEALMEDYIKGHEISVEVLRWDGRSFPLVAVDKGKTTIEGIHPLKKLREAPANINGLDNIHALKLAEKITENLKSEGNTDIDMIFDQDTGLLHAIEVNTRPSGTRYISTASTGIHPIHQLVNMAIGEWKPWKLSRKKFYALEIPVGELKYKNPPQTFEGGNSWILHGPRGHQRITIRANNKQEAERILRKLKARMVT